MKRQRGFKFTSDWNSGQKTIESRVSNSRIRLTLTQRTALIVPHRNRYGLRMDTITIIGGI